jgi:hypothetical protein
MTVISIHVCLTLRYICKIYCSFIVIEIISVSWNKVVIFIIFRGEGNGYHFRHILFRVKTKFFTILEFEVSYVFVCALEFYTYFGTFKKREYLIILHLINPNSSVLKSHNVHSPPN